MTPIPTPVPPTRVVRGIRVAMGYPVRAGCALD
jgi:hypothetical protein